MRPCDGSRQEPYCGWPKCLVKYADVAPSRSNEAVEREALEAVLGLIYEIVGAPKDAPYGDLPGYVREALKGKPEIPEGMVLLSLGEFDELMRDYEAAAPTVEEKGNG